MINEELIAAYLDGNTTAEETIRVIRAMQTDKRLSRLVFNCYMMDEKADKRIKKGKIVDMSIPRQEKQVYMAAKKENNDCEILCELFILKSKGITTGLDFLAEEAKKNGWLSDAGTKLDDFGKLLENKGLKVKRKRQASLEELKSALDHKKHVLVAVDGGELIGDPSFEKFEDQCIGKIPDHAVVVTAYNDTDQTISIYDPTMGQAICSYSYTRFLDAWDDSKNYIITVE